METISASCCSINFNEKTLLNENNVKELLTSCRSLNYYEKKNFKTVLPQLIATLVSGCFHTVIGISFAYSAILIPQLMDAQESGDEDAIEVSKSQSSWIASCFPLVVPFGAIVGGIVMDSIGRLNMLKLAVIPSIFGWILIATASNIPMLITGRILSGVACVWGASPAIVYITEISRVDMRGSFVSMGPVCISLGMLIVYLKGWFMHWRLVAWLCIGYSIIPLILMIFIPESPAWLVSKGKIEKAKRSLEWFHKYQPQSDEMPTSYAEMKLAILQKEHALKCDEDQATNSFQTLRLFFHPVGYKPLLILSGLFFFQQFAGTFVILFYGVTFFKEVGTNIDPYFASILLGLMRLIMSLVNVWMMKRYNRRSLYFVSSIGMAVTLGISGLFTKWIHEGTTVHNWIPVCMLVLYVLFMMIAVLPIPFTTIAEMFPIAIRGVGHSTVFSIGNLLMFAALQSYYTLNDILGGSYGIQYFYAIFSLGGLVYSFVFLPETYNKKLSDIEDYFRNHSTYLSVKPDNRINNNFYMKNVMNEEIKEIAEQKV